MSARRQIIFGRIAKFFGFRPARDPEAKELHRDVQLILDAVRKREAAGHETSLRALHRITPLAQGEALRAAALLEQAGLIAITRNVSDELASTVKLCDGAHDAGAGTIEGRAA